MDEATGATNVPWAVDAAFRRPGRFDRVLFVPPSDLEARRSILELLLKDRPAETDLRLDDVAKRPTTMEWLTTARNYARYSNEVLVALGNLHLQRGEVTVAHGYAEQALNIQPEDADGLVLMGHILLRRGKVDEAREHALWALSKRTRRPGRARAPLGHQGPRELGVGPVVALGRSTDPIRFGPTPRPLP